MISRITLMVLGLLLEGEKHGYELIKEMDERGFSRWIHVSKVAVYKSLSRLEKEGCLESWTEKEGAAPERRVYSLTPLGEERMRDMLYELCASREPLRLETLVETAFTPYLKTEEALDALEQRLCYLEAQAGRLSRERAVLKGLLDEVMEETMRHELAIYREERRFLSRVMELTRTGKQLKGQSARIGEKGIAEHTEQTTSHTSVSRNRRTKGTDHR